MQFDKKTFTVPVTSGGATTNNYPVGGFVPGDSPSLVTRLLVKPANFTNDVTVTVALVDGETGITVQTSAAFSRNTAYSVPVYWIIAPAALTARDKEAQP